MVAGVIFSSLSLLMSCADKQPILVWCILPVKNTTRSDVALKDLICGPSLVQSGNWLTHMSAN